ncbi:unnamed protein product [Rotaria sp. Silwood1]|nr:unnamed protein product [Rotaria sp. Silwood1]
MSFIIHANRSSLTISANNTGGTQKHFESYYKIFHLLADQNETNITKNNLFQPKVNQIVPSSKWNMKLQMH